MRKRMSHDERMKMVDTAANFVVGGRLTPRDAITKAIPLCLPPRKQVTYDQAIKSWKWLRSAVDNAVMNKAGQAVQYEPPPPPQIINPTLEEIATDKIVSEMMRRFTEMFKSILKESMGEVLKSRVVLTTSEQAPVPKKEERPRKLKVGIVSLLPAQEQLIRREFGNDIDLRIIKSNMLDSASSTRAIQNCHSVILMTNFIGHQRENSVRKYNQNCIRVSGGMTELRDQLTKLYVNFEEKV